ncbi:MAG: helix-turn-helix domain-containing protein [Actinophytocola sp.]|nr:helix-turn-helix domain-containing protein [Actinophytocola sp.]
MNSDQRPPLESVDRALLLIDALSDGRTWSVKEVADHLEVAPSTAHRLLNALKFRGFAEQAGDRGYRAGTALRVGVDDQVNVDVLTRAARPALEMLHADVNETAQLMVRRGTHIEFLDGIESDRPLRVVARFNDRLPAHCSAGGKALLADLDAGELDALYVDGLPTWPTASITTLDALMRHLSAVRRSGHGINRDETESGVSGVGVVFRGADGRGAGALTLAIPTARFARGEAATYAAALERAAHVASDALSR